MNIKTPPKLYGHLLLLAIIALGAFLQFFRIASYNLGFDESYSVYVAHQNIGTLLHYISHDTTAPLYYLLLKLWMHVVGDSVLAIRSLSAVCMIVTIPIVFLLVKELFSKRAAFLAATFVAIGPFVVRYGHEARMYGTFVLFAVLATYLLTITLRKKIPGWLGFAAYALVMAAAIYNQYYSFLVLPLHWILAVTLRDQPIHTYQDLRHYKDLAWSQALVVLAFVPWLPHMLSQTAKVGASFWLPLVGWRTIPATFLHFSAYQGSTVYGYISALALTVLVVILAVLLRQFPREQLKSKVLFFFAVVVFTLPALIFMLSLVRPVYVDRYFIVSAVFYYMALGVILSQKYHGSYDLLRYVGVTLVLVLFAGGIIQVAQPQYDGMQSLLSKIDAKEPHQGYRVLVASHTLYYQAAYYNTRKQPILITEAASKDGYGDMFPVQQQEEGLVARTDNLSGTVWVLYYGSDGSEVSAPSPQWHEVDQLAVPFQVQARKYVISR